MEGNNSKSVSYQKETVCETCMSIGITHIDCVCTYMKDYPTVTLEFEVFDCCGHVNDSKIPLTDFNLEQLGNEYFQEELDEIEAELELQARINIFTYQIDSFRTGSDVSKAETAVRVTCIETGQVAECSKHRSYYQNLDEAKRMLNEQE